MNNILEIRDIGIKDYQKAYQIQRELVEEKKQGSSYDTLIITEHPPVITLGGIRSRENLLLSEDKLKKKGIKIEEVDRGGDVTYHGPGQIVGYPVLNLRRHKKDIHWLLRSYEEVFIRLLDREFNIKAKRISGHTGVWVDNNKITAIGIKVSRWITSHGFAFNVNPEMEHFSYIIPCGIKDKGVISLQQLVNERDLNLGEIKKLVIKYFLEVFDLEEK